MLRHASTSCVATNALRLWVIEEYHRLDRWLKNIYFKYLVDDFIEVRAATGRSS